MEGLKFRIVLDHKDENEIFRDIILPSTATFKHLNDIILQRRIWLSNSIEIALLSIIYYYANIHNSCQNFHHSFYHHHYHIRNGILIRVHRTYTTAR